VIIAMIIAGIIISVISFLELAFGLNLAGYSGGTQPFDQAAGVLRVTGPYASNAAASTAALVCLAAALYWTRQRAGTAKGLGVLACVIIAAGALSSFHRAAGIAVVAMLVLGTAQGVRNRGTRFVMLTMLGVIAGLAFYAVSGSLQQSTFYQGRVQKDTNILARFASWDQSIAIFKRSPLDGVGPGQAPIVQQQEGLFSVGGQSAALTLHNSFLTALAELGLVGFGAFMLFWAGVVRVIRALRRVGASRRDQVLYSAVVAGSVGFVIMSLTLTILREAPAVLMFAVLLGVAAGRLDRLREDETAPEPLPVAGRPGEARGAWRPPLLGGTSSA
jgi:O-antigen ligase